MGFSLIQKLHETPIAFFDVETSGASAELGEKIIEIGVVRVEGGKVVAEYQQLMNPRRRISRGVTMLTGITQEMCDGQPCFGDQLPRLMELLSGAVLAGHNVRFDLAFLDAELRRCGRDLENEFGTIPVFDTVRIARNRFGRGGNALQELAPRLGVFPSVAHRALADAQTTSSVFEKLMEPVGGWGMMLCDVMQHQGGPMRVVPTGRREPVLPLELEEALDRAMPVIMEYVDANDQRTNRTIIPRKVLKRNGELLLKADCQLRGEARTFKVDRIVQLTRFEAEVVAPTPEAQPNLFS